MADVQDILDIKQGPKQSEVEQILQSGGVGRRGGSKKRKSKPKMAGVSREVLSLYDGEMPIMPTKSTTVLKNKRKIIKPAAKWKYRSFKNPARSDNLLLKHWQLSKHKKKEYKFAKANKKIRLLDYSDEDYEQNFKSEDWSRKETDYLMSLCREYDLRWIVILDRFECPEHNNQCKHANQPEKIKQRYYEIAKKLSEKSAAAGRDPNKLPLLKFEYDVEKEKTRRIALDRALKRSPAECDETEHLLNEVNRIQTNFRKLSDIRERTLLAVDVALGTEPVLANISPDALPDTFGSASHQSKRRKQSNSKSSLSRVSAPQIGEKKTKLVNSALDELGVENRPLPASQIYGVYENLRRNIVTLLDFQKIIAHQQYQLEVLRAHKQGLAELDAKNNVAQQQQK